MSTDIKTTVQSWLDQCPFESLKSEVQELLANDNQKELIDRFYKDLEFGTGGMRAVMAAGTNRMNEEVIGKTTQGLANYILQQGGQAFAKRGVAIAHDSRNNHRLYLEEIASVFAGNGIHVHVFDQVRPTPLLSYAVRELGCVSGIVITASHNTSEYNGYKVYWEDGGQIIPPHDTSIIEEVRKIKTYHEVKRIPFSEAQTKGFVHTIPDTLINKYYQVLKAKVIRPDILQSTGKDLKIVYSPLHGASGKTVMGMFQHLGFTQAEAVTEQLQPDGNFPTVKSPNPEEGAALEMALNQAKQKDADLIFANDPDGDRMAVGVKTKNNEWQLLNGNQMGSIMAWYILSQLKEKGVLPNNGALIKTIVTTELQTKIAEQFGCKTFNTLTGFKYIGALIRNFEEQKAEGQKSFEYLFGGEESYGYLPYPIVRDKDGVMSLGLAAEIAAFAKTQNKTLVDLLNDIFVTYGTFLEDLISITLKGKDGIEKMNEIMNQLRKNPPQKLNNSDVIEIRDYQLSEVKNANNELISKIDLPKSNVLEFQLKDGTRVTARPSGTEPKIKFYFSVQQKSTHESLASDIKLLQAKLEELKKEFSNFIS